MKTASAFVPLITVTLASFGCYRSASPDPSLRAAIDQIRAIDDHAHPYKLLADGEKDDDWDALTYDGIEPFRLGARVEDDDTWIRAAQALYHYPFADLTPQRFAWIAAERKKLMQAHGDGYPAWVLDGLGIETMLANRVALGRGLAAPRFRWVPYDDALLFPLDNSGIAKLDPDRATFFPGVNRVFRALLAAAQTERPATLDAYLANVVLPTLARQKREGAIAIKFEATYLRSLDFGNPPEGDARRVYEAFAAGGVPSNDDYRLLQDFLFRRIAREAGRLGLVVHIHCGWGPGRYFRWTGNGPMALESALNDPALKDTKFVLLHGGWPAVHEMTTLLAKPNVWIDISWQTLLRYPRQLASTLREWLEFMPDKVLFGTDAFGLAGGHWELAAWVSTTTARAALTIALDDMIRDGEITRARALELGRAVLHDNAATLYGWMPAK